MLFGLTQSLALLLLGKTPQQNAGGPGTGLGSGGSAQPVANGGNAAGAQASGAPGSNPNPVPAPPGFIQPQEFYTLNENDPDSRFTGVQMREALVRAGQYDTLQSEYHRQQGVLVKEQEGRLAAESQLQDLRDQERLTNYMSQIGYGQGPVPSSPTSQPSGQPGPAPLQQPGQQPGGQGTGAGADDAWLQNYGFADASPGQPEGAGNLGGQPAPGQPGSPNTVPQTNSPQSVLNDPRKQGLMMRGIIQDELSKVLTPVQEQIPNAINAAVDLRFNQQARQDGVKASFQAGRKQLADDLLNKWGIEDGRSRDILDKWALSSAHYEEASRVMQGNYADDNQRAQAQQFADQKIAQGNMFFNAAIQDAVTAAHEGQATRQQQEAQSALLSGNYVNMGELAEPQRNVWDPVQIDQVTKNNLNKAMEIAETTGRLQSVAGPMGGPVSPDGFLQPGAIQPGQPAGYGPPLTPTQPMWGPAQGNYVPPQPPGGQQAQQPLQQQAQQPVNPGQPQQAQGQQMPAWGAYQNQGYQAA